MSRAALRIEPRGFASVAVLLAWLVCGCSGGSDHDVTFGGTLLSSPVQLLALDGEGEELIAVLREEARIVALSRRGLEPLSGPEGCTSPLAAETAALDDERRDDLLILDSACGGWVALREGTDWQARAWDDYLPRLPPGDLLTSNDLDGDGDADLAASTAFGVSGYLRSVTAEGEGWVEFERSLPPPNVNRSMVNRVMIEARFRDGPLVLLQRFGALAALRLDLPDEPDEPLVHLPQAELELLKPFDGFDQLIALGPWPECDVVGTGAGYFAESARAPKPLVSLRLLDDAFVAKRIDTRLSQVIAAARLEVEGKEYLGVVEGAAAGFGFELLERTGCEAFESRAFAAIDFDVPGVVPIAETPEQLAASSGEWLIAGRSGAGLSFSHFDGRVLRRFVVDPSSGSIDEEARND